MPKEASLLATLHASIHAAAFVGVERLGVIAPLIFAHPKRKQEASVCAAALREELLDRSTDHRHRGWAGPEQREERGELRACALAISSVR